MINPYQSIQSNWLISKASRAMMAQTIICLECIGCFWDTWSAVYRSGK